MKITARSIENLEEKGLNLLPNEIELTTKDDFFPDSYGECIGRYNINDDKFESFFIKDIKNEDTKCFDEYREKCNLLKKKKTVFDFESRSKKQVIDYYVMYEIMESSKFKPTITEDHVDCGYCINGTYRCEYELLFASDGATRRIVVPFTSNNIPMYQFIGDLEDMVEEVLNNEADDSNPFKTLIDNYNDDDECCEIIMFDEMGNTYHIGFDNVEDFLSMLVSVRLIGYEFIENKKDKGDK